MSDFTIAFNWLMDSEDPKREYASVPDVGGEAISGINSHEFPTAYARIAALPQPARFAGVYNFYLNYFWNPGWYNQLTSNEIAKRVFDAAVNMGSRTALILLQRCLPLSVDRDGIWGPDTISAANSMAENDLVVAFIKVRKAYYMDIVASKPEDAKYLNGWLKRAGR